VLSLKPGFGYQELTAHPPRSGYLAASRTALAFAEENLECAKTLAAAEKYPQAVGLLFAAIEETTKAAVFLYADLDLMTFDRAEAGTKRYWPDHWLNLHARKHVEFARSRSADIAGAFGLRAIFPGAAAAALLTYGAFMAVIIQASAERWEDLRELAFYSGPPSSGRSDVNRPKKAEYRTLVRLVEAELNEVRKKLANPSDRAAVERGLPTLKQWKKLSSERADRRLWDALQPWVVGNAPTPQ
jgi:AbiV family abortive infection protein